MEKVNVGKKRGRRRDGSRVGRKREERMRRRKGGKGKG